MLNFIKEEKHNLVALLSIAVVAPLLVHGPVSHLTGLAALPKSNLMNCLIKFLFFICSMDKLLLRDTNVTPSKL